jgi:hypothetical protein
VTKPVETAKSIVDKKTAAADFNRFAAAWELDTDVEEMSIDDRQSFEQQKAKIIKGIMIGRAAIDESGDVRYTLKDPVHGIEEVTLKMPSGDGYMEMDRFRDQQSVRKFMAVMGHMTGRPVKAFSGMSGIDLKFCMAVSALFLGS